MGRNPASSEITSSSSDDIGGGANVDLSSFHRSTHDQRSLFKRSHPPPPSTDRAKITLDRLPRVSYPGASRHRRRAFLYCCPPRGTTLLYGAVLLAVCGFVYASFVLQSSITTVLRQGIGERKRSAVAGLEFGSSLTFVPARRFVDWDYGIVDRLRREARVAVRPPRIALILGNVKRTPEAMMLFTVMKNLQHLGYMIKLYAVEENGEARAMWEQIGSWIAHDPGRHDQLDWSLFEGVVAHSLQALEVISSLMQEPFCSVPLIWIIQEDALARRLKYYNQMGWERLTNHWRSAFKRADVVVFSEYSLPLLYSVLDNGNFFVIPGSPLHVWAAENYMKTHSKETLRLMSGFDRDDLLVLVVGSSFFYNGLSWDYAVAMHSIGPLLTRYAKMTDSIGVVKFLFLCGNSTDGYADALKAIATRLGLNPGLIRHYGLDSDVNGILLMSDIVLYGTSQEEQGFPSFLIRAMTFGIPIIAPDLPIITKHVTDGVQGMIFSRHILGDLLRAFSPLVSRDGVISELGKAVGSSGKHLAKNLVASDCIISYAKLMESVLNFPSDTSLPNPISQIEQDSWEWNSFGEMMEKSDATTVNEFVMDDEGHKVENLRIVSALEDLLSVTNSRNITNENGSQAEQDILSMEDWEGIQEIESFEDWERQEMSQIDERMEKDPGNWDEIYRTARKSERLKFEVNERDEGELERTGQPVCIYEIYSGAGGWPLLHHGSLYRGLSLSTRTRRSSSDDIDAVSRLHFLNDSHYRDLLCETGGMFSVAYKVDDVHMRPWIGFQSWRASGRRASLSHQAERILEETIQQQTKGDVIYFWTRLDMDGGVRGSNDLLTFWSMCDVLNGGKCRSVFEKAFSHMYSLPPSREALPPMPADGGHWSALHSWVMPTPSFLEFVMFSRMLVDSVDALHSNTSQVSQCLLGSSELERKHCYCRFLELLVNVWAYHSARRMVYIDPHTGSIEEQHPIEQRKGYMWAKYFNATLLKSMDEDLAEAADDGDLRRDRWLWPLTGEVFWQGIYEREREERYRLKMDKKRKMKEKLIERQKRGYTQKPL